MVSDENVMDMGHGRRLYVSESGRGEPTVVFEAGFGATSLNWTYVQRGVAKHLRTVSYDRYGLGWSSAAETPRTPKQIAMELHGMLCVANIEPPYVLVGHSFGGLVMRRFALDYPEETLGLVLIDPMRTEEWPPVNGEQHATVERAGRLARHAIRYAQVGVARLVSMSLLCRSAKLSGYLVHLAGKPGQHLAGRLTSEIDKLPPEIRPALAAHWSAPGFYRGLIAHLDALRATVEEMHEAEPISDRPVVVLTPRSAHPVSHQALVQIGSNSRQIIAAHSRHWIHLDEPDLVIDTILEMAAVHAPVLS